MKQLYRIIFLFILIISVNNLNAKSNYSHCGIDKIIVERESNNLALPTATINTNAPSVCINGTQPIITFTGSGGVAPYTFTYKINGGTDIITSQSTGDILTLNVPTTSIGDFVYTLVSVTDSSNATQIQSASVTVTIAPEPVIDFTFTNDNSCSGTSIQFNSIIVSGATPYSYAWDFGDGSTSTSPNPTHVFNNTNGNKTQSFNVTLTVTANGCAKAITKPVSIQNPGATLNSSVESAVFNGFPIFKVCTNDISQIDFINTSATSSTDTNYVINWGDSTPNFSATTFSTVSHTYSIGLWTLTYTVTGQNGCSITRIYKVFVGNNPAVGIGNPGNTNICISTPLTFPITGTENNPPGTIYTVTFNDGSTPITFNHPPPATITHTFLKSSCGVTSSGQQNSFSATIEASNPCDVSFGTVVPIRVSAPPIANFTLPKPAICLNTQTCFTDSSTGGALATNSSCANPKIVWIISPSTGYTLNSGTLGSDNSGSTNTNTWTGGTNSICPVFSVPGTYTITMKTGNSCDIDEITKTICVESSLIPAFTLDTNSGCAPLAVTTTNTTNISNACATPTYLWTVTYATANCGTAIAIPNQTTKNASYNFTIPGIYTIKLTATNSCGSVNTSQTVEVKKPPTISSINGINANYCGSTTINPTATVNSCAPASSVLTYAWSFPGGSPATAATAIPGTITYGTAGNYTVSLTVTNECGVSATSTKTFSVGTAPALTNTALTQTICSGSSTDLVNLTADTAGTTFSWTATATSGITGFATSGVTNTIPVQTISTTNTSAGTVTYAITPSLNGCSGTVVNYVVTVNPAPNITSQPASNTICQNGTLSALSVVLNTSAGTPTYQWYSNATNNTTTGTPISGETSATYSPPSTTIGTIYYYCIITLGGSGGCSSITSAIASIVITAGATVTQQPTVSQNLCVGGTIASPLTVSYSGGTGIPSYQWFSNTSNVNSGGTLISGATNSSYTPTAFSVAGVNYFYAIITLSGNGCGPITSNTAEVKVVADPTVTSQPLATQTLCQSVAPTDLSVTAAGDVSVGALSYQWYSNGTNSNSGGTLLPGATNTTFTPPTASVGTRYYYCEISQSGLGCNTKSNVATVIVNLAPAITLQPSSSTLCLGATPTLLKVAYSNGVGTPQYQWYSNTTNSTIGSASILGATNDNFNPPDITVGTTYYYCIITLSSGGCSVLTSAIAEIKINQNPVIANKSAVICSGTAFTVAPDNSSGDIVPVGTTYTWTTPVINPSNAVNGALAETIPQNNISQTLINKTTSPATVTYTVSPISGSCVGTNFTIVVTVNPSINPNSIITNGTCFGINNGSIQTNITGGIPFATGTPYLISWIGPNGFTSNAASISNLQAGDYTLSVLDDGGCPFSKSYKITEPDAIVIETDQEKDITCFDNADGAIAITIAGGTLNYIYTWTKNGTSFANTEDLSNLSPGVYAVSVSDSNNCGPETATFTITEPPVLALNLVSQTNILCFGTATGAIDINVAGGTPVQISPGVFDYNYAWTGPNGFTSSNKNLNDIFAGTYNLTVTDNSGCSKNLAVLLTQTSEIIITATTTPIICYGDNNASINIAVSGGIAPYTIQWSNLGTGLFQDNLSAGDYLITVTDANDCVKTLNVNIPEAPIFTINPVVKNISCFGMNDGSINLNLVGGIAPLKLVWSDGSTAGLTRNNLGPGTYTVTITDGKPCTISRTFIILEPQKLVLSANVTHAFDCDDANSGAINLLVAGGTPPFTYAWSNGATTEDLTAISAGNYSVSVTDARGCTKSIQNTINRQPPIVIGVDTKTDFNCETKYVKQTFVAQVSGGMPPYQLSWSSGTVSGANNEMMNTNQNGTVVLGVTDNLGCTANYSFNVKNPVLGNPDFTTNSIGFSTYGLYSIIDPIQFTNTATGDFINIAWDFGDGSVSNEVNPIHSFVNEGSYVVTQTVTYPFGCIYTHIITLTVDKGYELMSPNGFTPNGDGINETFKPVFVGLKSLILDVYDTWGELVYSETGETLQGWDGKVKGKESENGNYYYKVKATTFYGTVVSKDGPFTLIK
ncbi:PKD domain-containing protein [Flavobacterium sp. LB2P84]|uniref:PKD domain-containing protein n=1 Tax=Flavobacterium yafengii TaxID=3041253 RepID=UPI0024A97524|nr:PKD domain-containing protein [Flavobacterium yafengii]MDI6032942.1 PKD domain-containing protein [Flavobacterium yafengii]